MKYILYLIPLVFFCACSPSEQRKVAQEQDELTAKLIGKWKFRSDTNTILIFMPDGKLISDTDGMAIIGSFSKLSNVVDAITSTVGGKAETSRMIFITPDELVVTSLGGSGKGEALQRLKK